MPIICVALTSAFFNTAWHKAKHCCQISMASCSTQPSLGKYCANSSCTVAMHSALRLNSMTRLLVVPWSIAIRYCFILLSFKSALRTPCYQNYCLGYKLLLCCAKAFPALLPPLSVLHSQDTSCPHVIHRLIHSTAHSK